MCVALVLDLSKPNELWVTLEKWLQVIKSRVEIILNEISDTNVTIKEHLKRDAWLRVGEDHAVRKLCYNFIDFKVYYANSRQFEIFICSLMLIIILIFLFVFKIYFVFVMHAFQLPCISIMHASPCISIMFSLLFIHSCWTLAEACPHYSL